MTSIVKCVKCCSNEIYKHYDCSLTHENKTGLHRTSVSITCLICKTNKTCYNCKICYKCPLFLFCELCIMDESIEWISLKDYIEYLISYITIKSFKLNKYFKYMIKTYLEYINEEYYKSLEFINIEIYEYIQNLYKLKLEKL